MSVSNQGVAVKVRIRKTPVELEVDGIKLDRLAPGAIRDMSASLASWLIVEGLTAKPRPSRMLRNLIVTRDELRTLITSPLLPVRSVPGGSCRAMVDVSAAFRLL